MESDWRRRAAIRRPWVVGGLIRGRWLWRGGRLVGAVLRHRRGFYRFDQAPEVRRRSDTYVVRSGWQSSDAKFPEVVGVLGARLFHPASSRGESLTQHCHLRICHRLAILVGYAAYDNRRSLQSNVHVL